MQGQIAALRRDLQVGVGQATLAMMNLPRYRNQTLADLSHLVIDPLIRNRLVIAHRAATQKQDIVGIAIWASVSDKSRVA